MPDSFLGNGFTKSMNGDIIPELLSDRYLKLLGGAELFEVNKDGTWKLRGVFVEDEGRFKRL